MILVDTSVWIGHFRTREAELERLLSQEQVLCHPFVFGELALGSLRHRDSTLRDLSKLRVAELARDAEVMYLIENQKMHGLGVGYVDAHLLASVKMSAGSLLWTRDKQLNGVAAGLGLSFVERRVN